MKILGINPNLLHDSGAALVVDGKLIAAVNEERLSRKKQQPGVPVESVYEVLRIANMTPADLDAIHIVGYPPLKKLRAFVKTFARLFLLLRFHLLAISFSSHKFQSIISRRLGPTNREKMNLFNAAFWDIKGMAKLLRQLRKKGFSGSIVYVPHYLCHLLAAYHASGFADRCLVVNIEGSSFEFTTNIFVGEKGKLTEVDSTHDPHSAGHFYACFTELLGFRPGFHEGKVTGLSSFGRVREKGNLSFGRLYEIVQKMIWTKGLELRISENVFLFPHFYSTHNKKLPLEFDGYAKEDIAWACQKRLEEVVVSLVKNALQQTGCKKIVLTGGVAANVRMNQAVKEIPGIAELFIYPAMGDFGNAHGAAVALVQKRDKAFRNVILSKAKDLKDSSSRQGGIQNDKKLKHVYLGPSYTKAEIQTVLQQFKLQYEWVEQGLEKRLARLLLDKKIVCLFQGRMEYGPRALGNRSILADAQDPSITNRLNHALKRSEFMPFAPVILYEERNRCLKRVRGAEHSAEFMTMTFNCSDFMKTHCPAVVHVDNTARPQLLKREINPFYYDIIKEYDQLSGVPVLINTSFNIHDEPIVCTPQDAIRTFLASGLDYLVMENFLVFKPK